MLHEEWQRSYSVTVNTSSVAYNLSISCAEDMGDDTKYDIGDDIRYDIRGCI